VRSFLFFIFLIGLIRVKAQTSADLPPLPPPPAAPNTQIESPNQPEEPPPQAAPPQAPVSDQFNEMNEIPQPEVGLDLTPTARDPFAKPASLIKAETEVLKPVIDPSVYIDKRIEAIRRYPILNYTLVGIIFDVEHPKAIVRDPDNTMHLITTNQRIGNQEGVITKIEKGELIVEEKGKLVTIKLLK
jgi:Tfp pilus assembly protein PilP